jgi:hypothetical protein
MIGDFESGLVVVAIATQRWRWDWLGHPACPRTGAA